MRPASLMMNWSAVKFITCSLCDEELTELVTGKWYNPHHPNRHAPKHGLCGYCAWKFTRWYQQKCGREIEAARQQQEKEYVRKHRIVLDCDDAEADCPGGWHDFFQFSAERACALMSEEDALILWLAAALDRTSKGAPIKKHYWARGAERT